MGKGIFFLCAILTFGRLAYCDEPAFSVSSMSDKFVFRVLPEESSIGFTAQSTLHEFSGVTKAVEGFLQGIPADLENSASSNIKIDPSKLKTGIAARDKWMLKDLEVTRYKEIVFTLKKARVIEKDLERLKGLVEVSGILDLHGVKREIIIPVDVKIEDDKIICNGETPLSMSDYSIRVHSMLFLRVADKVVVNFHLVARRVTD